MLWKRALLLLAFERPWLWHAAQRYAGAGPPNERVGRVAKWHSELGLTSAVRNWLSQLGSNRKNQHSAYTCGPRLADVSAAISPSSSPMNRASVCDPNTPRVRPASACATRSCVVAEGASGSLTARDIHRPNARRNHVLLKEEWASCWPCSAERPPVVRGGGFGLVVGREQPAHGTAVGVRDSMVTDGGWSSERCVRSGKSSPQWRAVVGGNRSQVRSCAPSTVSDWARAEFSAAPDPRDALVRRR